MSDEIWWFLQGLVELAVLVSLLQWLAFPTHRHTFGFQIPFTVAVVLRMVCAIYTDSTVLAAALSAVTVVNFYTLENMLMQWRIEQSIRTRPNPPEPS